MTEKEKIKAYLPEEYKFLTEKIDLEPPLYDFKLPFYDKEKGAVFIPPNVDVLEISYEHSEKGEPVLMVFRRKGKDVFILKEVVGKLADKLYCLLTNNKYKGDEKEE